ncbi:phospho-sugar mutase [soil metagenome]
MIDHSDLIARSRLWIEGDPDPGTRQDLQAMIEAGEWAELTERMDGLLEFGTAGLRGAVEAGSNRMNRATVIRTTAGLAEYLRQRPGVVVVGYDGRTSSQTFAEDTVGVLTAAGLEVRYFNEPVPTPIVAFAAKDLEAAGAVVITASHNPPADNGYKVYDSNAAQIVPPTDESISMAIARARPANEIPRVENAFETATNAVALDIDEVYERYRSQVEMVRPSRRVAGTLTFAYTPIHGVGWRFLERLMRDGGHDRVSVVESQRDPDGAFPTVSFPNPEEPGAMDEVMELGTRVEADLVLANDPDGDRLAVAIPHGSSGWKGLTGNQVGVLMADWLLDSWSGPQPAIVINSIVSSPMLADVAGIHDARFEQTLTGFKWIANAALDLEDQGHGTFLFGYEEALGYSVGPVVRDKDGLSAALVFADMAAALADAGSSVEERLANLYERVGLWVSSQLSISRPGASGLEEIDAAMARIGDRIPDDVAGHGVMEVVDYRQGADQRPRWLATTALVALSLPGGGRVLVRPSGTEPKLKIYVDLPGSIGKDLSLSEAALLAQADQIAQATARFLGF